MGLNLEGTKFDEPIDATLPKVPEIDYAPDNTPLVLESAMNNDPQTYKEMEDLAKQTGIPQNLVEMNPEKVKKQKKLNDVDLNLFKEASPVLYQWLGDYGKASKIHKQTKELSALETALLVGKNFGAGIYTLSEGAAGILETPFRLASEYVTKPLAKGAQSIFGYEDVPSDPVTMVADYFASTAKDARSFGKSMTKDNKLLPRWGQDAMSGVHSGFIGVAGLTAAVITRNPSTMLQLMGGSTFGTSMSQALEKGVSVDRALLLASSQTAVEVGTELLSIKPLMGLVKGNSQFLKNTVSFLLRDMGGEQVATALQDLNDWAILPENKDKTFTDYAKARPDAALSTAIATLVGGGIQAGAAKGVNVVLDKVAAHTTEANRAEHIFRTEQQILNDIVKTAQSLELDSETVQEFVGNVDEDAKVFLDSEKVGEILNQKTVDEISNDPLLQRLLDEVNSTRSSNSDIELGMAEFVTDVATSPHYAELADHMKMSAEADTPYQRRANRVSTEEDVQRLIDSANLDAEDVKLSEQMFDRVRNQLIDTGRMDATQSKLAAKLIPSWAAAFAQDKGMTLVEVYEDVYKLKIEGPATGKREALGDVFKQDELDALIAEFESLGYLGEPITTEELAALPREEVGRRLLESSGLDKDAGWTDDRLGNVIADFQDVSGEGSSARVAFMNPADFVNATHPDPQQIADEAGKLDENKLKDESQTPFLIIEGDKIIGHEGRHRMAAMNAAGVTRVPVLVVNNAGEFDYADAIGENQRMKLKGQHFLDESKPAEDLSIDESYLAVGKNKELIKSKMTPAELLFQTQAPTLLAPNGKPSRLNARQHAQVRTPEFKKWFGDWENDPANASKVVDENGEPLVVYHGSEFEFQEFQGATSGGDFEPAMYFSSDRDTALSYSSKDIIYETYIKSEIPFVLDAAGSDFNEYYDTLLSGIKTASDGEHDGVIVENIRDDWAQRGDLGSATTYIVFNPNQIKSATGNSGEFDAGNDNILYQTQESVSVEGTVSEFNDPQAGVTFKTGEPVMINYIHNTTPSVQAGETYQQHIDLHGKYLTAVKEGHYIPEGFEGGTVTFKSPLVLEWNTKQGGGYDDTSWKANLSRAFGGLTGSKLSKAVVDAGYDAIVTIDKGVNSNELRNSSEIVDLTKFNVNHGKDLAVVHNLSAENIIAADELGGLAAPSVAVIKTDVSDFSGFGEVSLLAKPQLLEDNKARTFDADIYSPRQPRAVFDIDTDKYYKLYRELDPENLGLSKPDIQSLSDSRGADELRLSSAIEYMWLGKQGKLPKLKNAKVDPVIRKLDKLNLKEFEAHDDPKFNRIVTAHYRKKLNEMLKRAPNDDVAQRFTSIYFQEDGVTVRPDKVQAMASQVRHLRDNGGKDLRRFREDMSKKLKSKKARTEYEAFVKDLFNDLVKGKKLFKGFTDAGDRRYAPYNMQNVVKEMTQQLQAGESTFYGAGTVRSKYANEMKTIEQIQAKRNKIISESDMEVIKDESAKVFQDALEKLKPFYKFDAESWGYAEDAGLAIIRGRRGLNETFNMTPEADAIVNDLIEYLVALPTSYFESKIQRAVSFSEFDTAVVPKNLDKDALKVLKDAGLKIRRYDSKQPSTRKDVIEKQTRLLFQESQAEKSVKGYYDPANSLIRLTEASDASTFIHEFAHFMYDMELKYPGSKHTANINGWFRRNADEIAKEANGYLNKSDSVFEQSKSYISDYDKRAEQVAKAFDNMGLRYDRDSSRISQSEYITVYAPDFNENTGEGVVLKLRVSDHMLPPRYEAPDYDIKATPDDSHDGLNGDWLDAVEWVSERFDVDTPSYVKGIRVSEIVRLSKKVNAFKTKRAKLLYENIIKLKSYMNDDSVIIKRSGSKKSARVFIHGDELSFSDALEMGFHHMSGSNGKVPSDKTEAFENAITYLESVLSEIEGDVRFQDGDTTPTDGEITADDIISFLENGNRGTAVDAAIATATHEYLARGFEAYVMEGKAPSSKLRETFRYFSRLIVEVYRKFKFNQPNLDDHIRKVFDRLIATDEQIVLAQARSKFEPMFTEQKLAGMTDDEWAKYTAKKDAVTDKAKETLRDKLIKQLRRETTSWWKAELEDIKLEKEPAIARKPVHVAREILRSQYKPKQSVIEQLGKRPKVEKGFNLLSVIRSMGGVSTSEIKDITGESSGIKAGAADLFRKDALGIDKLAVELADDFQIDTDVTDGGVAELKDMIRSALAGEEVLSLEGQEQAALRDQYDIDAADIESDIGATFKLDHAFIKEHYGETVTTKNDVSVHRINPKLNGMTIKGGEGVTPDQAAAVLGYGSGDELIQDLIEAPTLNEEVTAEAEAEMKRIHGDMLNDGTIEANADAAMLNEDKAELLLIELKKLSKRKPSTDNQVIREIAEDYIGKLSFREINPSKFRAAEIKAAKESATALAKGDKVKAADAKLRQLQNHHLAVVATNAKTKVMSIVTHASRYRGKKSVREAIQKAGGGYWEQINKILTRFEFRKSATLKAVDEVNESVNAWLAARLAEGEELTLSPAVLDETYVTHWKNVPFAELQGIHDTLKNIEHVARYTNKIKLGEQQVEFDTLVAQFVEHVSDISDRYDTKASRNIDADVADKNWFAWANAQMSKISFLTRWMDKNERAGMAHDMFMQPFTDALHDKFNLHKEITEGVMKRLSEYMLKNAERMTADVTTDTGAMKGSQVLAVALNTGNKSNLEKMLLGEGWAENAEDVSIDNPQLQSILTHMTKEDAELVQFIWDEMDKLYPLLNEVYERTQGIKLPKIESSGVTIAGVELDGGYYPVVYSKARSSKGAKIAERKDADIDSMFSRSGMVHQSVTAGSANKRKVYSDKIHFNLDTVPNHFEEVIHYVTHHDAVRQTNKLINDPRIEDAITGVLGEEEFKNFRPWLSDIAKDGQESQTKDALESVFQQLRTGVTLTVMGFKASTGIMQLFGVFNTAAEVGMSDTFKAVVSTVGRSNYLRTLRKMFNSDDATTSAWDFAVARSKVLPHRMQTMDRELSNVRKSLKGKSTKYAALQNASMWHIATIQTYMVDLPSWTAAYNKEIAASGDEAKAVNYADWVIENVQGSGATKDMAKIMRNQNKVAATLTMFMTFFSSLGNMSRGLARDVRYRTATPAQISSKVMLLYVLPVMVEMLLRGEFGGDDEPEDVVQNVMTKIALYPLTSVPFVRDATSALFTDYSYNFSPVSSILEKGIQGSKAVWGNALDDGDISLYSVKSATKAIAASAKLPGASQAWATGEHLYNVVAEGEDLTLRELIYGPKR